MAIMDMRQPGGSIIKKKSLAEKQAMKDCPVTPVMNATTAGTGPLPSPPPLVLRMIRQLNTATARNVDGGRLNAKRSATRCCRTGRFHLRDFMHATSMHGLKYAAEKEASCPER